ncbi:acyltransferase family protein [Cyanobacteria bacterium FACHB-63]|nr:acyltransferase family protein [Cyanobacteria bacterium FACHB-63]
MTTQRNGFIDFFKGLLILWVIHIHTVFWSGREYLPEVVRQVSLLIDVASFFFISGYLTKVTEFIPALKRSAKQFIILYSNYLVFSLLLLVPLCLIFIIKDNAIPNLQLAILSKLRVDPLGELWGDIPVFAGSLWYMAVYFSILSLVPLVIHFFNTRNARIVILALLLSAFALSRYFGWNHSFLFSNSDFVYFYLFIFMAGVGYRAEEENISLRYIKLSFLANLTLALVVFLYPDGGVLQIQEQKFPPSLEYLVYSFLLIHIFVLLKQTWTYPKTIMNRPLLQVFEWCGKNVYFIYLIQAVVCSAPGAFVPTLQKYLPVPGIYIVVLVFNQVFTLAFTFIYIRFKAGLENFLQARRASIGSK